MPKIKVEIEVPSDKYCERVDNVCPMCYEREWGDFRCVLFDKDLELDEDYHHYCIRCDKCKQAEVNNDKKDV